MRTFALAIAALLLLTSCTHDPEPIEPTASPSAKPSATAPTLPPKATTETPDGAIAFVAHWIDVFNFSVNSGDLAPLRELDGSKCEGCEIYEDLVAGANRGASQVRGFRWTPGKAHLSKDRQLEVTVESRQYEVRKTVEDDWSKVRGDSYRLGFDLEWAQERWQVEELFQPKDGA